MRARRRTSRLCLFPFVFCLFLSAGCRSNNDLLEAELRSRENDVRQLREELCRTEAYSEALQRELRAVRQQTTGILLTPESASQTFTLKGIVLGRGTSGVDHDDCPGDEALQIVVEPRDPDGHSLKAPGTLSVQAFEVSPEGLKKPLCSWQVSADQLRRSWRSGLWSTGYAVVLPWKVWPTSAQLRVVVQFHLGDGRVFEADRDVTLRPTAPAYRKTLPLDGPEVPETPLPPPRKLETPPPGPDTADPGRGTIPASAVQMQRPVPRR